MPADKQYDHASGKKFPSGKLILYRIDLRPVVSVSQRSAGVLPELTDGEAGMLRFRGAGRVSGAGPEMREIGVTLGT